MKDDFKNKPKLIEGIIFDDIGILQIVQQEEYLLNNPFGRMQQLNNNPSSIEAINMVKFLITFPDGYLTTNMAAYYFGVSENTLKSVINRNIEELSNNGLITLKGVELKEYLTNGFVGCTMQLTKIRHLTLLNRRVILNIAMLLRDSVVAKGIRYAILNVLDTNEGKILLQREVEKLKQQLIIETNRANHYQNAYEGLYEQYIRQKDYINTEISYKDRYEDLLNNRGYYDHQAYANTFPYPFY